MIVEKSKWGGGAIPVVAPLGSNFLARLLESCPCSTSYIARTSFHQFDAHFSLWMLRILPNQPIRSTMKVDPAIIELLGLDPENTTVSSAGGGGCSSASTSKITSKLADGIEKFFFMKTGKGKEAEIMFEGPRSFFTRISLLTDVGRQQVNTHPSTRSMPLYLRCAHSPTATGTSPPNPQPSSL